MSDKVSDTEGGPVDARTKKTKDEGLLGGKTVSRREFLKYAGITGAAVGCQRRPGWPARRLRRRDHHDDRGYRHDGRPDHDGWTRHYGRSTTTVAAGPEPPAQDKIRIGAARPISGVNAFFEQAHFGPAYKLWVDDVNKAGGISAGKKLPIEMMVYDDQSDLDQSMRLLTKLMEEDKVDFVFAPCSTAFLFAAAGVANAHGYILMSAEGGATTLEAEMKKGSLPCSSRS